MILEMLLASALVQVPPIPNPSGVVFTCPDHAQDTEHEIDVIDNVTGLVASTILGGDPPLTAANEVVIPLNLQPIKMGQYRFRVRAVFGAVKSVDSDASDIWLRSPGKPGKPVAK